MKPSQDKLPSEAIELYNLFIHGEINRRDFMAGVQRFAVGGLTAATIVAYASASAAGTLYAWLDPEASEGALPFALALAPSVLLLIVRLKRRS